MHDRYYGGFIRHAPLVFPIDLRRSSARPPLEGTWWANTSLAAADAAILEGFIADATAAPQRPFLAYTTTLFAPINFRVPDYVDALTMYAQSLNNPGDTLTWGLRIREIAR